MALSIFLAVGFWILGLAFLVWKRKGMSQMIATITGITLILLGHTALMRIW